MLFYHGQAFANSILSPASSGLWGNAILTNVVLKCTKSPAHEAKGYYPLSLKCQMALYILLTYSSLFLVCRSVCTLQLFPSSGTESEAPLLSPTSNPPWDLAHLGSEAAASPGSYAGLFATRRVKVSHHRLVSHHGTNEGYKVTSI